MRLLRQHDNWVRGAVALPVALVLLSSGCAVRHESELAALLAEIDAMGGLSEAAPTSPVAPAVAMLRPTVGVEPMAPPRALPAPARIDVAAPGQVEAPPTPVEPGVEAAPGEASIMAGVQSREMMIHPNCLLQISVAEDPSLNGTYPVNDIGAVELGYIGPVILHNKTEKDAAEKTAEVLISRDFRTATVKVRILRASYGHVRLMGAVPRPGTVKVGAGDVISLNDALLQVGGLSPASRGGRIRVFRGGMLLAMPEAGESEEFALQTADGLPAVPDVNLGVNDLVYIVPRASGTQLIPKEILLLGEVGKPGFIRFDSGESATMLHLLLRVGGLPAFANTKAIRVVRRDEYGIEHEIVVNAQKILDMGRPEDDFPLQDGDRVIVPAKRFSLM